MMETKIDLLRLPDLNLKIPNLQNIMNKINLLKIVATHLTLVVG